VQKNRSYLKGERSWYRLLAEMALSTAWRRLSFPSIKSVTSFQQVRTTYVVERRYPARLTKPQKQASLRQRHYIYETLEDNNTRPQRLFPVLLRKYVEDVGQPGEIVTLKEQTARFLIMTQKAAYSSKENLDRFGHDQSKQKSYSSKYAATTINVLTKFVLNISMNKENPWTLEPWHIRSAFRKAGVCVPESAITMPESVVSGPDLAIEGKEFYIIVTINHQEKVTVRCRIHHWATNLRDKVPRVRDHWKFPVEPIFADDKDIVKELPEIVPPVFEEHDDFKPPTRRK